MARRGGRLLELSRRTERSRRLLRETEVRGAAHDALARFAPPPAEVSREACLRGDRTALDRWHSTLDWSW